MRKAGPAPVRSAVAGSNQEEMSGMGLKKKRKVLAAQFVGKGKFFLVCVCKSDTFDSLHSLRESLSLSAQ